MEAETSAKAKAKGVSFYSPRQPQSPRMGQALRCSRFLRHHFFGPSSPQGPFSAFSPMFGWVELSPLKFMQMDE